MRKWMFVSAIAFALQSQAQVSLSVMNHWQITPNDQDSSGVFCRTFYNPSKDRFYVVYAGRQGMSGPMKYFRWREYDPHFNYTGVSGTLEGFTSAGDYAMVMVGTEYYHVTLVSPWSFKLSKYDADFNLLESVTFPLDPHDSGADMLLNDTNGRLIIGAFHEPGTFHPAMPMQSETWSPRMHKWEYGLDLKPIANPIFLQEIFTTWGASCIFNNGKYHIITMHKWPDYQFNVCRYDANWKYIDTINLSDDGQWGQGILWDGRYYYLAYHTGNEHRSGNITIGLYDANWSLVYDTTITNYSVFEMNSSPPLNTLQYNANRPFLTRVSDTLYVSYDVDDYMLVAYGPPHYYAEGNRWQAHVMKLKIDQVSGIAATPPRSYGLEIFPNPFSAHTTLRMPRELNNATLSIINCLGQTVAVRKNIHGRTITIHRNHLPTGTYFVRVTEGSTIVAEKGITIVD